MCYKQAGLMQDLRARLINGGFSEVEFRILNTESAGNESEGLWRLRYAAGHPTIPVLQEPPSSFLWQNLLDGAVDHILVIDRCSRLTYQVITPWSILHFPYVKAAILSTYEDDPCGPCAVSLPDATSLEQNNSTIDDSSIVNNSTLDDNENVSISTNSSAASIFDTVDMPSSIEAPYHGSSEQTQSSDTATTDTIDIAENIVIEDTLETKATLAPLAERTDGTVPVRVVMHAPHLHRHVNGTVTQHEYLELQTGNPEYHGHLVNDNNIVVTSRNDEQTQKRKKYKVQRRKGKLRSETIQLETQENNYEDTKLKHHRDKDRPEKKKQKMKNDEQNASEEAAAAATPPPPLPPPTTPAPPLQDPTTVQLVLKDLVEVNTEAEIPQEIQEHYDYKNMPYFSSKHLHKPLKVTEATTAGVTESSPDAGETNVTKDSISKPTTSDKKIIRIKDHRKWKSHSPQRGNVENEKDVAVVNASIATETSNSDQQSHDTNILHELEDSADLNVIDSEEHKKYKPNKAGTIENQPPNGLSNEDDDENKKEVIQHYSQLLKWIHYSLPETRD